MPYAEGRRFYDADSHLMETPDWLASYAEPAMRDRIPGFSLGGTGPAAFVEKMIARGRSRAGNPAERAAHEAELMTRKSWDAYGAFDRDDRRRALDALCEERGVPVLFHVENEAPRKIAKGFAENGFTGQTDFHGGGENFTGLLYMAVSHWAEIALAALIFDQILEKFPRLMVGVIELG